ncbi:hypothetical protein [Methylobacterium sp. ID0610]|uniref:hypothetical protein n=1 Tax=Methylobacterium carpenticola TaxID=3344827 RepID=UPI00367AF38E
MIVAVLLFICGFVSGLLTFRVPIITALSAIVTVSAIAAWTVRGELSLLSFLILLAYLMAMQSGYFAGLYVRHKE